MATAKAKAVPSPREVERALDKIDAALSKAESTRMAARDFDLESSIQEICKTYRQIKPAIDKALDLIESIGKIFGYDFTKMAASIRRVLGLIETLCA